jgi:hypothetical protein
MSAKVAMCHEDTLGRLRQLRKRHRLRGQGLNTTGLVYQQPQVLGQESRLAARTWTDQHLEW